MNSASQISSPKWSKKDIIAKALHLSYRFRAIKGVNHFAQNGYSFWELFDCLIYPNYKIKISEDHDFDSHDRSELVLGAYDAEQNAALISSILNEDRNDPRRIWTLAHEVLGHGVLHGKWLREEFKRIQEYQLLEVTESSFSNNARSRLERQANLFTANLVAPQWAILLAAIRAFGEKNLPIRYVRNGEYCFNSWGRSFLYEIDSYESLCSLVARELKPMFPGLSRQALMYRVQESKLVNSGIKTSAVLYRLAV